MRDRTAFLDSPLSTGNAFEQAHPLLQALKCFNINKIGARQAMLSYKNRLLLLLKLAENLSGLTL